MSDRPSDLKLQYLVIAAKDVITEWHDLGLHLGLPDSTLKLIGSSPDIEGHLRMMLSKWLDYDPEASWDKLANALNTMGKNVIAANIRSKYVIAPATPVNDPSDDDKTSQEINRNILQKIKCRFASLVLKVRSAMEAQQVKMSDVHQFLMTSFQGCCIPEAPDLTKLFNIITQAKLWSYDHYVPLQELAEQFLQGDEQIRKHISDYRVHLSGFFATTKIIDFINLSELEELEDDSEEPFAPEKYKKHYRKLKVKLKLKNITELTLSYVNTLWQSFAEEFGLPSLTAVIDKIIDGSLVISWLVLPHIADKIRTSISKSLRFYQRHGIVEVWIDDELLYESSTRLYQASRMGITDEVKELLEGGTDVNEQNDNEYGDTALIGACRGGHVETVRVLIDYRANVDQQNNKGETGLGVASENDSRDVVRVLLEAKADPNITDEEGRNALYQAANKGHVEVVKMLVKYGAAVDIRKKRGWTSLMRASSNGYINIVKVLLEAKADPNITKEDGKTALHWAAFYSHAEVVKLLVKYRAAVDIREKDGWTGLMWASYNGSIDTVMALLEAKADPNITMEDGETALHLATLEGHVEVVKMLVKYGAAVDIRNKSGRTGLMRASGGGYTKIVMVLLEAKADPNITSEDGVTALHQAAEEGCVEVVKMLVKYGAAVDTRNKDSETALHKAALRGHVEVVQQLMKHGAAVDIRNKEGLTALDVARGGGYQVVCEVLKQYTKQETELTEEQRKSIYQRLLKMLERTFLKEQVKKREEEQKKEHHLQREERVRGEREKRSLWNRLRGRQDRPGQIIGTALAPEK